MQALRIFFICIVCFYACTPTVRVKKSEGAPGFALSQYETFNFYNVTVEPNGADSSYNNRISLLKDAIRQELTAKGLTLTPANPDLLVNIGVVTTEKIQTRQTDFREAPRYIGQRRYSWKSQEVAVGRYREGTVTVDLVDQKKNVLVWEGVATAIIPRKKAKLQKTVTSGMAKLFARL